jgi:DNA-binding transcriptional MerR regulator
MKKLLTFPQLAEEIGVPAQTLRTWARQKKIPTIRMGHRSVFGDPDDVRKALARFEVRAIGQ